MYVCTHIFIRTRCYQVLARHEDVEEDALRHGRWVELLVGGGIGGGGGGSWRAARWWVDLCVCLCVSERESEWMSGLGGIVVSRTSRLWTVCVCVCVCVCDVCMCMDYLCLWIGCVCVCVRVRVRVYMYIHTQWGLCMSAFDLSGGLFWLVTGNAIFVHVYMLCILCEFILWVY